MELNKHEGKDPKFDKKAEEQLARYKENRDFKKGDKDFLHIQFVRRGFNEDTGERRHFPMVQAFTLPAWIQFLENTNGHYDFLAIIHKPKEGTWPESFAETPRGKELAKLEEKTAAANKENFDALVAKKVEEILKQRLAEETAGE